MSKQQKLHLVEKSRTEIIHAILTNTVKMITERKLVNQTNTDKIISGLISIQSDDLTYKINLDNTPINNKILAVKIIPQKITAVNKTTGISDFLNTFKDNHKIVIVSSINKKAKQYISLNYPNTEIFEESELLINLVDHCMVPKHEILTKEEAESFYKEFNCKKRNIPKMLTDDPVARYYNVKVGDIVRILRPSVTSSIAPSYRLVIRGDFK
jgi:DNA-directed RNA polymerase subunit H (RpoH/RPB5)